MTFQRNFHLPLLGLTYCFLKGELVLLAHLALEPSFSHSVVFLNKHLILRSHLLQLLVKVWLSSTVHLHINRAALLLPQQMQIL